MVALLTNLLPQTRHNGGVQVLGAYTLVTGTELSGRINKGTVKEAQPVGAAGVLRKERSAWTIATGKVECALPMMGGVENRVIKRKYAEHRGFSGK